MSDDYIECSELCDKTIKRVRVYRDEGDGVEMQIDLTDGTSFTCSFCVEPLFEAKLIQPGASGIETLRTYGLR